MDANPEGIEKQRATAGSYPGVATVMVMDTRTETLLTADGTSATLVRPVAEGPWPGVVMVHEIFGVDEVLLRQAHRLATAGYLVLAPDLFTEGSRLKCIRTVIGALRAGHGRPFELIEDCRQHLLAHPDCTGQVGVIGFCMGGGFALLLGAHGYAASSVNYGMVPDDLDDALTGSCPMVASYGGQDRRLAREVPRLEQALTRLQVPHDVKTYPTAGHSFLNDAANGPRLLRPLMRVAHVGPDPVAAEDAWRRIEAFFGEHLDQPAPAQ